MNMKVRWFWTVWAIGWWRVKSFQGKTIEAKVFIGPAVITWWS